MQIKINEYSVGNIGQWKRDGSDREYGYFQSRGKYPGNFIAISKKRLVFRIFMSTTCVFEIYHRPVLCKRAIRCHEEETPGARYREIPPEKRAVAWYRLSRYSQPANLKSEQGNFFFSLPSSLLPLCLLRLGLLLLYWIALGGSSALTSRRFVLCPSPSKSTNAITVGHDRSPRNFLSGNTRVRQSRGPLDTGEPGLFLLTIKKPVRMGDRVTRSSPTFLFGRGSRWNEILSVCICQTWTTSEYLRDNNRESYIDVSILILWNSF